MKRIITFFCGICMAVTVIAQADSVGSVVKKDTTRLFFGKKEIKIIESESGTDIKIKDKEETSAIKQNKDSINGFSFNFTKKKPKRFKSHWAGVSFGHNGFLNKDKENSLSGDDSFMSLNNNPTRSLNINFHFGNVSQRIIGNTFGLVSGLGLEFNNYFFENNNTIQKEKSTGRIVPFYYDSVGIQLEKSKLALIYLTIPLLFELHIPQNSSNKTFWLSGGVTGSIKINSHTKVVYRNDGDKKKDKNRDDFNIAALRYGFTLRGGYSNFYVYGNYYPAQLFEKNKGPELYPYSVGIGFHFD